MDGMKTILATGLATALFGCATPYQESGYSGGFEQQRIAEDAYLIRFSGNGFTSPKRAKDFAMLRAAEIGKKLGYTHFAVVGKQDLSGVDTVTTGSTSSTTGTVSPYGTYSSTTTTTPTQFSVYKPGIELGIKYFEGPPSGRYLEVLEVTRVFESLASAYGVKSNSSETYAPRSPEARPGADASESEPPRAPDCPVRVISAGGKPIPKDQQCN
jgi:hypothetical protein